MFNVRKTNFTAGGLIPSDMVCGGFTEYPKDFSSPSYIDGRPHCIKSSNQHSTPHCAGYAMAGMKEVRHWKTTGVRKQYDGDKCYAEAKKIDMMPNVDGTSLYAVAQASQKLGWIKDTEELEAITSERGLRWALHKYGCCLAGFQTDANWNRVNKKTGYIGNKTNTKKLGGHAVLVCYYDEDSVGFQNSWGTGWGCGGFGRMTWLQFSEQFMYGVVFE